MIKAVFMDFDGTVADSRKIHEKAIIETLEKYGIDYDKSKLLKILGIRLNLIFKKLNIRIKNFDKFRNEFYESMIKKTSSKSIKKVTDLNPLKSIKVPVIIISNSKTKYLEKAVSVLGIGKIFPKVYGEEKFNSKEAMIKRLIKKYGITSKEIVYVGDSLVDIEVARNVNCVAIAMSTKYSWATKKEIGAKKPDYIISDFSELKDIVSKI